MWIIACLLFGILQPSPSKPELHIKIANASASPISLWYGSTHLGNVGASCSANVEVPALTVMAPIGVTSVVNKEIRWNAVVVPARPMAIDIICGGIEVPVAPTQDIDRTRPAAIIDRFWSSRTTLLRGQQAGRPLTFEAIGIGTKFEGMRVVGQLIAIQVDNDRYVANTVGMLFVRIQSGKFTIGQAGGPAGRSVTISHAFYMSAAETTVGQLALIRGNRPDVSSKADLPATSITWQQAFDACGQLQDTSGWHYTLPTEAQWEFACQGGVLAPFNPQNVGPSEIMWHHGNSGLLRHPVAKLTPNSFGLFDMHGNVREWCRDWWSPVPSVGLDPLGPASGTERVRRGGAYNLASKWCTCGLRDAGPPNVPQESVGFRMILETKESSR